MTLHRSRIRPCSAPMRLFVPFQRLTNYTSRCVLFGAPVRRFEQYDQRLTLGSLYIHALARPDASEEQDVKPHMAKSTPSPRLGATTLWRSCGEMMKVLSR